MSEISSRIERIAKIVAANDNETTTWKIENIDIWGPKDWGEFETERFSNKREIAAACIDYLVQKYPDWRGRIRAKWFGDDIFHIMDKNGESLLEVKREETPFVGISKMASLYYEDRLSFDENGECHDKRDIAMAWGKIVMPENHPKTVVKNGDLYLYCIALGSPYLTNSFWAVYPGVEDEKEVRSGFSAKLPSYLVRRLP